MRYFQPRRLAPAILAAVAVFTAVVVGVAVLNRKVVPVEPGTTSSADLAVKDVNIREATDKVRWHLTAKQALVYDREGRTSLREVAVEVEEPERSWKIRGEEGDLVHARNDIEIRQKVVLISSDGFRLETEVLRWNNADKRVWTDAPVTITHPSGVIRGSGLDVRLAQETTTVSGRVQAVFTGRGPS